MGITHLRNFARVAGALAITAAIGAASPALGAVPSTDCQSSSMPQNTCLGDPLAPDAIIGRLGSPASPEEDLSAALADLKAAPDVATAARARGRALAIIQGSAAPLAATDDTFLDRKAYAGIPLLNTAAKPKLVPAPTEADPVPTVDVREVRFGDHAIL